MWCLTRQRNGIVPVGKGLRFLLHLWSVLIIGSPHVLRLLIHVIRYKLTLLQRAELKRLLSKLMLLGSSSLCAWSCVSWLLNGGWFSLSTCLEILEADKNLVQPVRLFTLLYAIIDIAASKRHSTLLNAFHELRRLITADSSFSLRTSRILRSTACSCTSCCRECSHLNSSRPRRSTLIRLRLGFNRLP